MRWRRNTAPRATSFFIWRWPVRCSAPIVERLGEAGLIKEDKGWRRVIIEKPFGTDLESARALDQRILSVLSESQIYRMDHFLGKETVQNIMVLRFANGIFEPLWNRDHIDHVQITVAETVGVERRGNFYEATGALRDMVPNHVFQLLSLTAMEPPNSFRADSVRTEKDKVLEALLPLTPDEVHRNVVRAQYTAGIVRGQPVKAYREEEGRRAGQHDRDLCRDAACDRQLALGRRAVLPAHRQGA